MSDLWRLSSTVAICGDKSIRVAGLSARGGLTRLHPPPVEKAVKVVDEKHRKAHQHREVGRILHRCERPQHDEHNVVGGIGERVIRAAAEGEVNGEEARRDGDGAGEEICRVQRGRE